MGPTVKGTVIDGQVAGNELIGFFIKGLKDAIVNQFVKIIVGWMLGILDDDARNRQF